MVDLEPFPDQKVVLPPATSRRAFDEVDSWRIAKRSKRARRDYETSTEDDLAVCLVLLARSGGDAKPSQEEVKPTAISADPSQEENKPTAGTNSSASVDAKNHPERSVPARPPPPVQTNSYKCRICDKAFPSFQALGGHKASHSNKPRPIAATASGNCTPSHNIAAAKKSGKIHECSICHKTYAKGQSLGGHMRKHFGGVIGAAKFGGPSSSEGKNPSSDVTTSDGCATRQDDGDCLTTPVPRNIDLNLPPPSDPELELTLGL